MCSSDVSSDIFCINQAVLSTLLLGNSRDHCNLEIDCRDRSDERKCDYLAQNDDYQEQLVPRDRSRKPIDVAVNVTILAIPVIDTVGLQYSVDFLLGMMWKDLRLTFTNINRFVNH